jgi:hypothetical protein
LKYDDIIAVGYRVNSGRAMTFRQWTTNVLRDFALRGYIFTIVAAVYECPNNP